MRAVVLLMVLAAVMIEAAPGFHQRMAYAAEVGPADLYAPSQYCTAPFVARPPYPYCLAGNRTRIRRFSGR